MQSIEDDELDEDFVLEDIQSGSDSDSEELLEDDADIEDDLSQFRVYLINPISSRLHAQLVPIIHARLVPRRHSSTSTNIYTLFPHYLLPKQQEPRPVPCCMIHAGMRGATEERECTGTPPRGAAQGNVVDHDRELDNTPNAFEEEILPDSSSSGLSSGSDDDRGSDHDGESLERCQGAGEAYGVAALSGHHGVAARSGHHGYDYHAAPMSQLDTLATALLQLAPQDPHFPNNTTAMVFGGHSMGHDVFGSGNAQSMGGVTCWGSLEADRASSFQDDHHNLQIFNGHMCNEGRMAAEGRCRGDSMDGSWSQDELQGGSGGICRCELMGVTGIEVREYGL